MNRRSGALLLMVALLFAIACQSKKSPKDMTDEELRAYANELAQKFIMVDGHIDLPDLMMEKKYVPGVSSADSLVNSTMGEFDYERAKKGGLDAPFMSIYVAKEYQKTPDMGKARADSLIDAVIAMTKALPDKYALANTPADIEANTKAGKVSLPMGMENGAPIGNDLNNLNYFFERGIRYITLTHNWDNQICDASQDTAHTWNGLSPYGREVVKRMNDLGIMVDISHVDDSTFYQVMELSAAPAIASHSSCRHFAPTVKRDMSDDMIRKLGEKGGVIMINFYTAFIDSTVVNNNRKLSALLKEKGLKSSDSLAKPVIAQFEAEHPNPTSVETLANHIDHVKMIAGVDHVGFGSDFDGVEGKLPVGMEDVSKFPELIYALLKRGYSEEDIEKICYKNAFRVWNKVIEVANQTPVQ